MIFLEYEPLDLLKEVKEGEGWSMDDQGGTTRSEELKLKCLDMKTWAL